MQIWTSTTSKKHTYIDTHISYLKVEKLTVWTRQTMVFKGKYICAI